MTMLVIDIMTVMSHIPIDIVINCSNAMVLVVVTNGDTTVHNREYIYYSNVSLYVVVSRNWR